VPTGMMLFQPRLAVLSDLPSVEDIVWRAYSPYVDRLGSGLIGHSQKMTVAASATAEKKTVGQRS